MFRNEGDELRGGDIICLDLSGESEMKKNWRKGVMKNLQINENIIKNLKRVLVMRYH